MSRTNKTLMITDPNQACLAKMSCCEVQEEIADPKKNLPPQLDFAGYTYKALKSIGSEN